MHRPVLAHAPGILTAAVLALGVVSGCGTDSPSPASESTAADPTAARDSTIAAATALAGAFGPESLDVTSATGAFAPCDTAPQSRYEVRLSVLSTRGDTADRVRNALDAQGWSGSGTTYSREGSTAEVDDTPGAESGSITLTLGSECGAGDPPLGEVEQLDIAPG